MADITSANSVLILGVTNLFTIPQQLQGFASDDMYSMANVDTKEVMMGADGILSAGYIPQVKILEITLQADSASNTFFESVYAAEEAAKAPFFFFGNINQSSVSRNYTLTNGVMKNYSPMAAAKKVLQPRKFEIHFQVTLGVPI
jgi:hypothetical protein